MNTLAFRVRLGMALSGPSLFASREEAAGLLWDALPDRRLTRALRLKLPYGQELEAHSARMRDVRKKERDRDDSAAEAVFAELEPTIGMLRNLDDTKSRVHLAASANADMMNHNELVLQAMRNFFAARPEAVGTRVEEKNPAAWYELTGLILLGGPQVMAAVTIESRSQNGASTRLTTCSSQGRPPYGSPRPAMHMCCEEERKDVGKRIYIHWYRERPLSPGARCF